MAMSMCKQTGRGKTAVDHITYWWDGIGNWRATPLA